MKRRGPFAGAVASCEPGLRRVVVRGVGATPTVGGSLLSLRCGLHLQHTWGVRSTPTPPEPGVVCFLWVRFEGKALAGVSPFMPKRHLWSVGASMEFAGASLLSGHQRCRFDEVPVGETLPSGIGKSGAPCVAPHGSLTESEVTQRGVALHS